MKIGKNGIDQKCSLWCQHSHVFVFSSSFMHFEFLQFYLKIHYTRPSRRLGNIFPLFLIFFVCVLSSTWHNLLTYFLWRIERPNWIEIGYLYIDLLNTSHHLNSSLLQTSLIIIQFWQTVPTIENAIVHSRWPPRPFPTIILQSYLKGNSFYES